MSNKSPPVFSIIPSRKDGVPNINKFEVYQINDSKNQFNGSVLTKKDRIYY